MAQETKIYSISSDIPAGKVNIATLGEEIRVSAIDVALDGISAAGDVLSIHFKTALGASNSSILDGDTTAPCGGLLGAHTGEDSPAPGTTEDGNPLVQLENHQPDGVPVVTVQGRIGKEVIIASFDFTDRTTWYSESTRETEKALSTSNDTLFTSGDQYWIDVTHGKLMDEEGVAAAVDHGYAVVVEVEEDPTGNPGVWTAKVQRTPFAETGGDFVVDYAAGAVTFAVAQTGKNVRASYSHMATAVCHIDPVENKCLVIEHAECQFASDVQFNTTLVLDIYGYVQYFAPELWDQYSPPGPYPTDTPIPIKTVKYKTADQIIDEALGSYPVIPVIGGDRGYTKTRVVFPFRYGTVRTLFSSLGMELRIRLEGDEPFGGERATVTFYCCSKDDPGAERALLEISG